MLEYEDDGLIMSQIRTADFARMSTSKQLSLWAILRAQLSSKKHLEAQDPARGAKTRSGVARPVRTRRGSCAARDWQQRTRQPS